MNNFYCAAPWRGLHITPQGNVKTCCAGRDDRIGNLADSSIDDIINEPILKEIRQSIKQGIPHSYCDYCVKAEEFGTSERNWHNSINPEFDPSTASIDDYIPTLIDVRWNTTCNLSCNYCDVNASSKWANIKKIPGSTATRKYYKEVCDYIDGYREHIRSVALVGGEPLLLPENEQLVDALPDNCPIQLITNLSVNLENNKIFKKLLTKSNVRWNVSFENLGAQFEYVRHGAQWHTLENNIKTLISLCESGHFTTIHAVYSIYSATQLVAFITWSKNLKLEITWLSLHGPECLNPFNHNQAIRDISKDQLDQVLTRTDLTDSERGFLTKTRLSFNNDQEKNLANDFINFTSKLESVYHPDQQGQFAKLWPEIYNILNT